MIPKSKGIGIFIRVTNGFNKSLDTILDKSKIMSQLKKRGYKVDRSTLGRFGYLLVCKNPQLLTKNPDLLLASSRRSSSEEMLASIAREMKK